MAVPDWVHENIAKRRFGGPSTGRGQGPLVEPKRGAELFENNDYPRHWSQFIGQAQAKEQLQVQIASAKARGVRLEHTLLASGQHGVGKSTLAHLITAKMGVGLVQTSGPLDLEKAKRLLAYMQDGDILFVDECHTLVSKRKADAEWLLPFMTEGLLYTEYGALEVPDVTIIGATTDAGRLPETILSRFMVKPKLVPYSDLESAQIVGQLAKRMKVKITEDQLAPIAKAANGNPRDMRSILVAVRDLQLAAPSKKVDLLKAFDWAGFSPDGLTIIARDILLVLAAQPNYTASMESLQSILGEPGPLRHHEQTLMRRGYLNITGRGRMLSESGVERAAELQQEDAS